MKSNRTKNWKKTHTNSTEYDVLDKISDSVSLHGNGRAKESDRDRMNDLERIDDDDGRYSSDIRWKLNYTRIHATYYCCCLIFVVAVAVCIPFFSPSSSLEHFSFNIFRWLFVASAWETYCLCVLSCLSLCVYGIFLLVWVCLHASGCIIYDMCAATATATAAVAVVCFFFFSSLYNCSHINSICARECVCARAPALSPH